jgi:hypothetical protein
MTAEILTLFTTYLIFPIIGLLIIGIAAFVAKKNDLLKNKRLTVYMILSVLTLIVPALLGLLSYSFMPFGYIVLLGVYILAGWYNDLLLTWVFNRENLKYRAKITFTLFQLVIAMALFVVVFNLCNDLKYGLWAATAMLAYVLPTLLLQSYRIFIRIPVPIYKVWTYEGATDFSASEEIDHTKLKVVSVELFKQEEDAQSTRINVKVPDEIQVGQWIKMLFDDYNKQSAHSPIDVDGEDSSGWIFYVKSWALAPRRYLDPDLTVKANRIREKHLIVAKRVKTINEE